jgi:hypothetical protein
MLLPGQSIHVTDNTPPYCEADTVSWSDALGGYQAFPDADTKIIMNITDPADENDIIDLHS